MGQQASQVAKCSKLGPGAQSTLALGQARSSGEEAE